MWLVRLFLLALVPAAALAASEVTLIRVWTGPRSAESFERISEYFSGEENTGGQTLLRSQPANRAGYYWLIRTRAVAAAEVSIELSVLAPDAAAPRTRTLSTRLPGGNHVTLLGLTGEDWPRLEARPVAWRLRLLDRTGRELAAEESFLWVTPASP